jgi:hypothetical protein
MKRLPIIALLLLLSGPAWAGGEWLDGVAYPGSGSYRGDRAYNDPGRDKDGKPFWVGPRPDPFYGRVIICPHEPTYVLKDSEEQPTPSRWEYKIIPEAELEKWLNEGWELEKSYTVMESIKMNLPAAGEHPVSKAIIKRK